MLKPTEAAVVASVTLRDVNRAIDEHILPEGFFSLGDNRSVVATACTLIAFYFDSARQLTADARLFVIGEAASRLRRLRGRTLSSLIEEDWTVRDEFLTIDLAPFVRRTTERMDRLRAASAMVASVPGILRGTPVVRGTRVPVHDVAASVVAGFPLSDILAAYPSITAEQVELAAIYAEANPPRGRPRIADVLPKGSVLVSRRRLHYSGEAG